MSTWYDVKLRQRALRREEVNNSNNDKNTLKNKSLPRSQNIFSVTTDNNDAGVTVKNIPTRENIPPVCFRVQSYAKLYPPDGRLVCGNVTFDSV